MNFYFIFLTESKPVHIEVKEQNEVDEEEEEEEEDEDEEEEESEESEDGESEGSDDEDEKTSDEREADSQATGKQSMEKKPSKEISSDSEYDSDDDRTKEERAYDKAKRRIEVLGCSFIWEIFILHEKQLNFLFTERPFSHICQNDGCVVTNIYTGPKIGLIKEKYLILLMQGNLITKNVYFSVILPHLSLSAGERGIYPL